MLKIDPNQTFEAPVSINLKGLQASFTAVCKLLHVDALEALQLRWRGAPPEYAKPTDVANGVAPIKPAVEPTLDNRGFINEWLVGFGPDVMDAAGNPLPFTPENVQILLNTPGAIWALIGAFLDGYGPAEAKNSAAPRAGS